jgi:hypothetical protein
MFLNVDADVNKRLVQKFVKDELIIKLYRRIDEAFFLKSNGLEDLFPMRIGKDDKGLTVEVASLILERRGHYDGTWPKLGNFCGVDFEHACSPWFI